MACLQSLLLSSDVNIFLKKRLNHIKTYPLLHERNISLSTASSIICHSVFDELLERTLQNILIDYFSHVSCILLSRSEMVNNVSLLSSYLHINNAKIWHPLRLCHSLSNAVYIAIAHSGKECGEFLWLCCREVFLCASECPGQVAVHIRRIYFWIGYGDGPLQIVYLYQSEIG